MVLLVPCNMQLDLEEVHRLLRSFLKENKNDNYSVISAISQGSSISKFRSLDSLRAALRVLGKFGVPKIGSIVEVRCSDSVKNRELSYMASMMREILGNRKLKIFMKKDEKKDSFRVTLINVGICLDEQIDTDLDLFQMEPECRMERKLNLDLPISNILE